MRFHDFNFFDGSKQLVIAKDNAISAAFDASKLYNVKPASVVIPIGASDSAPQVVWGSPSVATITHSLNCYPIVQVFNQTRERVFPTVTVLSATQFTLDFNFDSPIGEGETWICAVTYGAEYGGDGDINSDVASFLDMLRSVSAVHRIPPEAIEYTLAEGDYVHAPQSAPIYTLPAVEDATVSHELSVEVSFSSSALSVAFLDEDGAVVPVLPTAGTIAAGAVVCYTCRWSDGLSRWAVMPVMLGESNA